MNKPSNSWESLAARLVHPTEPLEDPMPFGFSTRVVAQWRAQQRDESLRRWSLWSLRAAISSLAACALLAVFATLKDQSPMLLAPPSAEFVSPPLTPP